MSVINWADLMKDAQTAAQPLPIGDYDMVVVDSQAVTASTGKPMYKVKLKVEAGPHANRTVVNNFVLVVDNPQALRMFFRHMTCFGLDANFFASNPEPSLVAQALMNRRARVTLGMKKFQGEDRNEITNINPPGAGAALGSNTPVTQLGGMPQQPIPGPQAQPMQTQAPAPTPPAPAPVPQPVAAAPQPVQPMQPVQGAYESAVPPQPGAPVVQPTMVSPDQVAAPQPQPIPVPDQPIAQPMQPTPPIPPGWVQQADGSIVPAPVPQPEAPAPAPAPDGATQPEAAAPPPLPFG